MSLSCHLSPTFFVVPIKRGNIDETKIQVQTIPHYRKVRDYLDASKLHYYTYQLKSARGLAVVIKGIESSVSSDDIKTDLEAQGFEIKYVTNVLNRDKIPQPMFKVELEPTTEKIKGKHAIYSLGYVLYRKVVVGEPHKNRAIVQCFKCQEYGHTRTYCKLPDVCVVCGKLHNSKDCTLDKANAEAKICSNCGENHTANYRGCRVYLELRRRIHPKQRAEQKLLNEHFQFNKPAQANINAQAAKNQPGISYADILKGKTNDANSSTESALNALTKTMMSFMKSMEQNMSLMLQTMNTLMQLLMKNQK